MSRPFVTASEMKALDEATMKALNCSSFELMDKVADALVIFFETDFKLQKGNILILTGPGNNGGDGYRLAEKLKRKGRDVSVFAVMEPVSVDCKKAAKLCKAKRSESLQADIIVDAVFGYQGRADLPEAVRTIHKKILKSKAYLVSLDVPSGVSCNSETANNLSFPAELTLCVGFPKTAFIREKVAEFLGRVEFVGDFFVQPKQKNLFALEDLDFGFQRLKRTSFKSSHGRLGILAGSEKTPGAAFMTAEAGHRAGAGYCSLFWAEPASKSKISMKNASFLFRKNWSEKDLQDQTALVVGPGGFSKRLSFSKIESPIVIDAAALDFISKKGKKAYLRAKNFRILTPHPGEAARMLNCSVAAIQKDRLGAARRLALSFQSTVYLKGAPGILVTESNRGANRWVTEQHGKYKNFRGFNPQNLTTYVNLSINPVFAKAGSGDILSGILGGFLAQSPKVPMKAVKSALVFQRQLGELMRDLRGSLATDQLLFFSECFRKLGRRS